MNALKLSAFALATMLAAPALASHTEPHPTGWFEYQYNEFDDGVLYCNALGAVSLGAGLYLHDRLGDEGINGLIDTNGGGTWIFQESNGVTGPQIGGTALDHQLAKELLGEGTGGHDPFSDECPNGDTVVF